MSYQLPFLLSNHACLCTTPFWRAVTQEAGLCMGPAGFASTLQFSLATLDYAMHALSFQANFDRTGAL